MTPPPTDDHTLNACLARAIGKEIDLCWNEKSKRNEIPYCHYGSMLWDPLHDANQLEEVEALIQAQHKIEYVWTGEYWYVTLDRWCLVSHRDKKRAFALAVYQMEQSNNNHKED